VNGRKPLECYRFFREIGSEFIQFIPIVERTGEGCASPRSVPGKVYGTFLVDIFNEWVRNDIGKIYVQIFEEAFRVWLGYPASLCIFRETCGNAMAIEHNGDLYSCDHYVFPEYKLGNIFEIPIGDMAESEFQLKFGRDKRDNLPEYCRKCDVRFLCNGECPKNRIINTPEGEPGLNYLCEGYYMFFKYAGPHLERLAYYFRHLQPPALYMNEIREEDKRSAQLHP
ncbi:MAG: SPASM domain-containing protein, partial [Acidobacteria bacterium]|nr:SPASM domain-containing protein [Acidobacteriota bacterium]